MKWIIRAYALVLLAYTGWRTYDFVIQQLPAGDSSAILALLFLFATEAGLALWHEVSLRHTTTREQHQVATALTWIDFVGSLGAGVADMILRQTFYGDYAMPPALALLLLYGLPAVVALNVAGVLLFLSNDSESQLDRAKGELRHEITRQALRELRDNRSQIAEAMKRDIYKNLRDDVTGKLAKQYLQEPPRPAAPINGRNGHGEQVFNAEATLETEPANPTRRGRRGES